MSIIGKLKSIRKFPIYTFLSDIYYYLQHIVYYFVYVLCRPLPLKNRVIASSFSGRKYSGNPKYIVEQIHLLDPSIEILWVKDNNSIYEVPEYIKWFNGFGLKGSILKYFYYATSKIWIDSHFLYGISKKRKEQLFINTWHGGLGIKKIGMDSEDFRYDKYQVKKMRTTVRLVDIFVSNSEHISEIYRRAFEFNGEIIKCGYPENDSLISGLTEKEEICDKYNISKEDNLLLYAPTFRDGYEIGGVIDFSPYNIDYIALKKALVQRFGGKWTILVRWHPIMEKKVHLNNDNIINVSSYPDIQDLIKSCDCMISDYSSCIFDAAIRRIPCFTYTSDLDAYEQVRGLYYKIKELPFPNAENNHELGELIKSFDYKEYLRKWDAFSKKTGLTESGDASEVLAKIILNHILKGDSVK